jgi:hypothetical protein
MQQLPPFKKQELSRQLTIQSMQPGCKPLPQHSAYAVHLTHPHAQHVLLLPYLCHYPAVCEAKNCLQQRHWRPASQQRQQPTKTRGPAAVAEQARA